MLKNQAIDIEEKIDSIHDFIFDDTMSLGAGSFASVRLGISKRTNKKYAIKTVIITRSKLKWRILKRKSKILNKKF